MFWRKRNGKHRNAREALQGSAAEQSSDGTGGSKEDDSDQARAFPIPNHPGACYYTSARNLANMTVPGMHPGAFLGAGYSQVPSHATALMQAQHNAMMQAMLSQMAQPQWASQPAGPPHSPTDLKSERVIAGEIIAWRAWHIRNDGELWSVVATDKSWSPDQPMRGDPAGGYGIHAYKGPHGPVLDSYVTRGGDTLWVIGEVALWGDIIEHTEGYRAEFARVHSLVTWHEKVPESLREWIRKRYLANTFKLNDAA